GMRGDDLELREVGGKVVQGRHRPRHLQPPTETTWGARAHAGSADVDEHRHAKLVDLLEQRPEPRIVNGEIPADGMEVKADEPEVVDGVVRLSNRRFALPR